MKAPIHKLTKSQIIRLSSQRCEHGHTLLEHYDCADEQEERIGHLDIEASNLDADFGQMLSWCIKPSDSKQIIYSVLTKKDIFKQPAGHADKRIVKELIDVLPQFDKITTWYGARFDLPFIRTRAMVNKLDFPSYGSLVHKDMWFVCRGKMKLSSNRLENACNVLLGKTQKTKIDPASWHGALRGDKKSLDYILDHNKKDVLDLEKIYYKLEEFARPSNTSI